MVSRVSSGSYDLNKWLYGGYEKDIVSVLYGGPGTGKTNFCLIAAVSRAKKGEKVIFIDTEGGFSSDRVKQLVDSENWRDVLKNILVLKPINFFEQKKAFDQMLKYLKDHVSLIIVDGMTMLYRLEFADARNGDITQIQRVNSELAKQMKLLAEIARKRNIPVLVTNQIYKWENSSKMVGGDILQYWGKCLIELENDRGSRRAFLNKHRSMPQKSLAFQIYDKGVRKRGWI